MLVLNGGRAPCGAWIEMQMKAEFGDAFIVAPRVARGLKLADADAGIPKVASHPVWCMD